MHARYSIANSNLASLRTCVVTFRVVTRVWLSVCLSVRGRMLTLLHGPADVSWGSGTGCPLVVQYWADLQSVHGLHDNTMEMRGRAQR